MDHTYYIREIRRIYDEYSKETIRLEKDRKVTEGLMGFGQGLGSAPCHDQFTEKLEQALTVFASNAPSSDDVAEVLAFMYDVPLKNKDNMLAYLMLKAVHTLTEKLIAFLTPEAAAALSAAYKEAYPKSELLPAQKKIAAQLQAQAGESGEPEKRGLLSIFKRRNK